MPSSPRIQLSSSATASQLSSSIQTHKPNHPNPIHPIYPFQHKPAKPTPQPKMCLQETSDTESYHRVRVIHRRPAALSPTCPMPRRSRYSYNCRSNSTSCSSSSSSSRTGYCSDSDYDCDSDSEAYVCRPRYSRTYYVRPSCERYECRPACSRPSYTTITRTRTRTRETIYPARREMLECEPVRRVCELGRRYRIL